MSQAYARSLAATRPVRWRFWGLLTIALLIAFAAPAVALWRANAMPLLARACLWPQAPQIGQTTWLIVTVPNQSDQAATNGPWARAIVAWDMPAMAMGTRAVAVPGSSRRAGVFAAPLTLTMMGSWWAHVTLETPGRPVWQVDLRFTVHPGALPPGAGPAPPTLTAVSACTPSQSAGQRLEGP
jgi:hypothetical protein